jgi:hypothetical protein
MTSKIDPYAPQWLAMRRHEGLSYREGEEDTAERELTEV